MECLMLWLRKMFHSVVLMALLQQHCFKKQTSRMGKEVFWVSMQSSAGCKPLAFLQWVFDASAAGEHWLEPQAIEGRGASCEILQPPSRQLCHRLCQWSCGSPSRAADTSSLFNDTQASCVIWKLSHFLPFHKKKSPFVWNTWDQDDLSKAVLVCLFCMLCRWLCCHEYYSELYEKWEWRSPAIPRARF